MAPSSPPSSTIGNTNTNTNTRQDLVQELEPWIVRTDQDRLPLQDSSSPQSRALDWLSTDDIALSANRTSSTALERYAVAVLFFATKGPNWKRQDINFLTQANVCDWNKEVLSESEGELGIYCGETFSVRKILLYEMVRGS